ncbi:hypothetical protein BKA64DRAFT_706319 [Cadophora sp. MPI-SDFR-AT-0126]|nr:hypothetical protein BKA64DRAFT_706319 [Leotiomycetes sp. MPI-SDFR-AT-0126]
MVFTNPKTTNTLRPSASDLSVFFDLRRPILLSIFSAAMVEVEVYIMGISLFIRLTSTSICFCVQTSRAIFISLQTLHIKPRPTTDQSPPYSPSSPPLQKLDTSLTSPNINDTMTTPQITLSGEEYNQYTQWRDSQINGNVSKNMGAIYTRILITCAEPGCDSYTTGHEVMKIDPTWKYVVLCEKIKKWVELVQGGDFKVRSNLRHCVWTDDHKIVMLKVNWNGLTGNGWSDNGETVITEKNYEIVLAMMAKRSAVDNLAVTISAS